MTQPVSCLPQWEMGFEFCEDVHKQPRVCKAKNDLKAEFYTGEQRDLKSWFEKHPKTKPMA